MDVAEARDRLLAAAGEGRLETLASRCGVSLLTLFGSAARGSEDPHDLDVAVLFVPGSVRRPSAVLDLVAELVVLTGCEAVDLLVLDDAEPIARFNGLVGALPLFEDEPGRWATVQMGAAGEVFSTEYLRREELARMAGS